MSGRRDSTTIPLETEMRRVRGDIQNMQLEIEATIGELQETLFALQELCNLEFDLGARLERLDRNRGKKPN